VGFKLLTDSHLSEQQLRNSLSVFQIPQAPQPEFRHELGCNWMSDVSVTSDPHFSTGALKQITLKAFHYFQFFYHEGVIEVMEAIARVFPSLFTGLTLTSVIFTSYATTFYKK